MFVGLVRTSVARGLPKPTKKISSHLYFSNELSCTPNGDCMQKLHIWEVDISTSPIKAHNPFVASSSRAKVLDI